jgi:hypothetical protein
MPDLIRHQGNDRNFCYTDVVKLVKHRSPIAVKRSHGPDIYRIREGETISEVNSHEFEVAHRVDGAIRILDEEYADIDRTLPFFTHFNLEFSGHRIGAKYVLPRITEQGYYRAPGDEVLPILSFDDVLVGTCTGIREHVPYKALRDGDFQYSMKHIQNVSELKKAILRRYSVSMPNLTEKEILNLGVAITTLRLEGNFA